MALDPTKRLLLNPGVGKGVKIAWTVRQPALGCGRLGGEETCRDAHYLPISPVTHGGEPSTFKKGPGTAATRGSPYSTFSQESIGTGCVCGNADGRESIKLDADTQLLLGRVILPHGTVPSPP